MSIQSDLLGWIAFLFHNREDEYRNFSLLNCKKNRKTATLFAPFLATDKNKIYLCPYHATNVQTKIQGYDDGMGHAIVIFASSVGEGISPAWNFVGQGGMQFSGTLPACPFYFDS